MHRAILIAIGIVSLPRLTLPAAPPVVERYERYAQSIAAKASELRWRAIPWITDLPEGVYLAARENRPLLVWASGDAPLERC